MILNIENFGVIKQAKFDLTKNLLLLCGKNSTGKTYISYVLNFFFSSENGFQKIDCYKNIYKQINENGFFSLEKKFIEEWLLSRCNSVKSELGCIFGISDDTCEKLFKNFNLTADYSDQDFNTAISSPINSSITYFGDKFSCQINKEEDSNKIYIRNDNQQVVDSDLYNTLTEFIINSILRKIAFRDMTNCRMLTVERNSIYTFKTELSLSRNELIDKIQQSGKSEFSIMELLNSSSRRYPDAIRASLRIANDLENIQKKKSPYSDIADRIENDLLMGEVSTTKNGDVVFHASSMPKTKVLPFHMSSSIVKTMASLVIYLRHIAAEGDLLIIDEPEMNFHPDVQVVLAKLFSLLVKKGLRMVVSTHSDYIVREFNNLIMANVLQKKGENVELIELGYTSDMTIDYNKMEVIYFERKKSGVTTKSLDIDEMGFSIESIDETINRQNEIAENLYAMLIDDKEK